VGLAAVLGALAAGAAQVVALDIAPAKLETALALGATAAVDARDPTAVEQVRDLTRGGVDHALELAGSAAALELAFRITRRGGDTVTAGLPNPSATLALPVALMVGEERTLKGSYLGGGVPSRDIPRYIALQQAGRLPVEKLLSGRLALDEINLGFDRLREGAAVRQIVTF